MRVFEFILKLLIFVSALFLFMFFIVMPQYSTGYNAALIDKWERLKNIDEPKIILVGDSNVAFGFDSQKIQEALDMPVVNFGLHGGIWPIFYTDMIKPYINDGDVVIIFPSAYDSTVIKMSSDCAVAWTAVENNFDMWKGISYKNYANMIIAYPTYLRRAINLWIANEGNPIIEGAYARAAFNEYGDISYPRPGNEMPNLEDVNYFRMEGLSDVMQVHWNEYNDYVKSKNANLLMSSPPIMHDRLLNDSELESLQKQLDEELEFQMISRLQDHIYPTDFFYDGYLHLNDIGVAVRTEQLIYDLKNEILH